MNDINKTIKHFESLQKRYTTQHNGQMCERVADALEALKHFELEQKYFKYYKKYPDKFIEDCLKIELLPFQKRLFRTLSKKEIQNENLTNRENKYI